MRFLALASLTIVIIVSGCTMSDDEAFVYEVTMTDGSTCDVVANGYCTVFDGIFNQKDHINTYSFYYRRTSSATFRGNDVVSVRMVRKYDGGDLK